MRRKILRLYFCVDTLSPCFPAAVLLCVRRDDVAGRMFMPASTAITAIPYRLFPYAIMFLTLCARDALFYFEDK